MILKSIKKEVKCIRLNDKGMGIVHFNNEKYLVPNLLPQEEALISFEGKKAKVLKIITPSKNRQNVSCDMYDRCGGCQLLHMNYQSQIEFKKRRAQEIFKNGGFSDNIDEIIEADKLTAYRNKMQVAYKYQDGKVICGFYEEDTHRIVPLTNCLVQSKRQNEIAKLIASLLKEMRIAPYNEDKRTGLVRFVLIKEARFTSEVLVVIVTNENVFPGKNEFIKRLLQKAPEITTVIQNINKRKTSIILGDEEKVLYGKGYIEDYLCQIKYRISSDTFFQINPFQTEKLYNKVKEYLKLTKNEVVVDAYCGIGTIGMTLASDASSVIAVEAVKQSVINATLNAKQNSIKNIRFYHDDATLFLKKLEMEKVIIDAVVLDPPRSGSTVDFLTSLKKLKPKKIVYVSCDLETLVRDLKILTTDYVIKRKCLVDIFVSTFHTEAVILLEHK